MRSNNMSTLSMRIVTYLIEYLGEFEFIFETTLDNESGDQMSSFDENIIGMRVSGLHPDQPGLGTWPVSTDDLLTKR